jgi:Ca2+-binding RTX toxin-like protein
VDLEGKDFFYNFQTHIVSGTLEEMSFDIKGRSQLDISGLDISNAVDQPGEFHKLIAALMGGGAPGSGDGADYKVLIQDLSLDAQHYIGGSGVDTYTGTRYGDRIEGNLGNDKLAGAFGRDTFVFDTEPGKGNVDKILDFSVNDDTIELGKAIYGDLGKGKLAEDEFNVGKKPVGDDAQILFHKGKLFYVDDDGDKSLFAKVDKGLDLSHDDFLVA